MAAMAVKNIVDCMSMACLRAVVRYGAYMSCKEQ